MKNVKIHFGKVAFLMCNFIFLLSGVCLVLLGFVLVNDTPRILLSRLVLDPAIISQPLLYYVALAFITSGLVVCLIAMLGCWAACALECTWLMGFYILALLILLLAETSFGVVTLICPQIIGVSADRDQMVTALMNNYGIPGKSQYTVAVDLAQTLFECCGMQSGSDYDGSSWWKREQETHRNLRVPFSCCFLSNTDDQNSFLDPKPINSSLCQAKTNSRYQYGRHVKGCIDKLNAWFKEHITIFLIIGLALVVVQLAVLLCAILVCLKRKSTVSSNAEVSISIPKSRKKLKLSEKNQTPERKKIDTQIEIRSNDGLILGENEQADIDFSSKAKSCTSKKTNLTDVFDENRIKKSPSLPLVLRNDHFQKYNDNNIKGKVDSLHKNSVTPNFENCDQDSDIYFTPNYRFTESKINRSSYKNADIKKNFGKNEYFSIVKTRCKDDQET